MRTGRHGPQGRRLGDSDGRTHQAIFKVGGNNTALVNLRQFIKDFKAELSMAVLDCNRSKDKLKLLQPLVPVGYFLM